MKQKLTISPIPQGANKDKLVKILKIMKDGQDRKLNSPSGYRYIRIGLDNLLKSTKEWKETGNPSKLLENPAILLLTRRTEYFLGSTPRPFPFTGNVPYLFSNFPKEDFHKAMELIKLLNPYIYIPASPQLNAQNKELMALDELHSIIHADGDNMFKIKITLNLVDDVLIVPEAVSLIIYDVIENKEIEELSLPKGKILKNAFDIFLTSENPEVNTLKEMNVKIQEIFEEDTSYSLVISSGNEVLSKLNMQGHMTFPFEEAIRQI